MREIGQYQDHDYSRRDTSDGVEQALSHHPSYSRPCTLTAAPPGIAGPSVLQRGDSQAAAIRSRCLSGNRFHPTPVPCPSDHQGQMESWKEGHLAGA